MNTEELREKVRRRHPATQRMGVRTIPGPWTVIEECLGCDLLAWAATPYPASGHQNQALYPRIGYELKVSRADMRKELLNPGKRMLAKSYVNEFYIAVPKGLLTDEELAWEQPEFDAEDFVRPHCPGRCRNVSHFWSASRIREKGWTANTHFVSVENDLSNEASYQKCPECQGRGYARRSRVEEEAPTLWIPPDIGLIEADGRGCRVRKHAPVNEQPHDPVGEALATLIRFVSSHPDPRHIGVVESDRVHYQQLRENNRRIREEYANPEPRTDR